MVRHAWALSCAMVSGVVALSLFAFAQDADRVETWPRWPVRNTYNGQAVRDLYRVLSLYERENGVLPGWLHAGKEDDELVRAWFAEEEQARHLYALKDYVSRVPRYPVEHPSSGEFDCLDVGVFDMPFSLLANGKALFDPVAGVEGHGRLRYADFDYLNKAGECLKNKGINIKN